jgi:4-hydroxy 2-oxovalerate aldolase
MVDSFGSVSPSNIKKTLEIVKAKTNCLIGFHGHNNLEMSLINTITAIDNGIDYIDSTVLGMGRGAGNLKTELLLTYLNKCYDLEVDFNILGDLISVFTDLLQKYKWGTNLAYMISGANSLPQKDIMEWTKNRLYSFNDIIRALDNRKAQIVDNAKHIVLKTKKYEKVIVIGGGVNAAIHADGIKAFIQKQKSIALIHTTSRNACYFQDLDISQYYCLVGGEGKRLKRVFKELKFRGLCVLPPYPRKMGTDVPDFIQNVTYELPFINFTQNYMDSCTTVALQLSIFICANEIYIVGYDGYADSILSEKEMALTNENRSLFVKFEQFYNKPLISLTPTLYKELTVKSVYQYL